MASSLALFAAEAAEASGPHPYLIGAITLVLLLTLLLVVVAFRNVGQRNRHLPPRTSGHAASHDHHGGHGDVANRH